MARPLQTDLMLNLTKFIGKKTGLMWLNILVFAMIWCNKFNNNNDDDKNLDKLLSRPDFIWALMIQLNLQGQTLNFMFSDTLPLRSQYKSHAVQSAPKFLIKFNFNSLSPFSKKRLFLLFNLQF